MRLKPLPVRVMVLLVCTGLLGSCSTGERRATHDWNRIGEGISRADVLSLVGQGDVSVLPDGHEVWHYSYGSAPDPKKICEFTAEVVAVLMIVGILVLIAAAASQSGGSLPDSGPGKPRITQGPDVQTGRIHFRVVFDRTGRVVEISGLEPCEE